jgi:hypothetical protein
MAAAIPVPRTFLARRKPAANLLQIHKSLHYLPISQAVALRRLLASGVRSELFQLMNL